MVEKELIINEYKILGMVEDVYGNDIFTVEKDDFLFHIRFFADFENLSKLCCRLSVAGITGSLAESDCIEIPKTIKGVPVPQTKDDLNAIINLGVNNEKVKFTTTDLDVYSIDDCAFKNNLHIEKVIIPQSVKCIENNAFAYCADLKEIDILIQL